MIIALKVRGLGSILISREVMLTHQSGLNKKHFHRDNAVTPNLKNKTSVSLDSSQCMKSMYCQRLIKLHISRKTKYKKWTVLTSDRSTIDAHKIRRPYHCISRVGKTAVQTGVPVG